MPNPPRTSARVNLGLITSPTLDQAGIIDEATTRVAQEQNVPVLYITADEYLQYGKNVPPGVDEQKFRDTPKFSMANAEAYSRFTGVLSNSFLVTGGRNQAVSYFRNNIDKGNPVVILNNSDVNAPAFDEKKGRVENASSFLTTMLTNGVKGLGVETGEYGIPKNQFVQDFDRWLDLESPKSAQKLLNTPDNPNGLVLILDAKDPDAAKKAAAHLNRLGLQTAHVGNLGLTLTVPENGAKTHAQSSESFRGHLAQGSEMELKTACRAENIKKWSCPGNNR
jgi:hypothetical protein